MKFVALLFLSIALLSGCASGKGETVEATPVDLQTYEGLSAALTGSAGVLLYDVRTAEEYAAGHIPGAIHIPYDVIGEEIQIEDKEAVIVVYCRTGNRSGQAKSILEGLGYTQVNDFGGINKWRGALVTGRSPG